MPIVQTINGNHTYIFKCGDGKKDEKCLFKSIGKLACSTDVNFNWSNAATICWQTVLAKQKKEISFLNNFVCLVE